jgi:hypothetical protein
MPYASLADVLALAPQLTMQITGTSRPSAAQVDGFIDDIEAEVESALINMGYVVPVTGTRSLKTLRVIVSYGALARVLNARAFSIGKPSDQGAVDAQQTYRWYLGKLADPHDLTIELNDAVRTDRKVLKDKSDVALGMATDGVGDDDYDPTAPTVTRNQRF